MSKIYDVLILGAGPGGLAAGLYAGRARLSTLIVEKGQDGGQIAITDSIENYPGQIVEGESGPSLIKRMTEQAERFGCERAHDANFFEDLPVFVVGGGDSAVEEAMYLTKFASSVTLIHRRHELRAAKSIQERAFQNEKLHIMWDTVVEELSGDDILQKIKVKNVVTGEEQVLEASEEDGMFGIFGFIGRIPTTEIFQETNLEMDDRGYIPTDEDMHTNIPGVFTVGDVRVKSLRQVVTAAADGAIAATQAEKYINEHK